ncbi:MAG: hypothetical protein ACKOCQ_00910 [Candidatus Nitrosotenuis sp.]
MYKVILSALLVLAIVYSVDAFAEEPRLATFHETATVLVDQRLSNNVTASVSLQTTSLQEFKVPSALDAKIRNDTNIVAVVITNEDQCVLGVQDSVCVMINVKRAEGEGGIKEAQQKAKVAGEALIGDINSFFGMDAKFHSVFIHYDDSANRVLGTEGQVSGRGTVSAVYTIPFQSSDYMFNRLSGALIPAQIRGMGGFHDVAQNLSKDDSSRVTFTILPKGKISVMQLKVAEKYSNTAKQLNEVNPSTYLKVDELKRSDYYKAGFFPLNSIVHVVILPQDNTTSATANTIIEKTVVGNQTVPADLKKNGWFFDSNSGKKVEAMYLFGESYSANSNDLKISFGKPGFIPSLGIGMAEIAILVGIGATAAGAVVYYLKGIRSK